MHESVLRDFLIGAQSAAALKKDLVGAVVQTSSNTFSQHVTPMKEDLIITRDHALRLCDAVLEGSLAPEDLEAIAFCIISSDQFRFEDDTPYNERVLDTLHDWDSPEINYVLSRVTVEKFRHRLLTGESTFTRADLTGQKPNQSSQPTSLTRRG